MKQRVVVEFYHRSKTVWIARGDYKGKSYEDKASTPGAAAKAWADAAKYHSN
ncbi:MAG TPA: hypothetical protein VFE60_12495 [Roseiarcus sp.]|jgi:hypothetical protein|nr:hypothetical protein [Roseiarcus sp.]